MKLITTIILLTATVFVQAAQAEITTFQFERDNLIEEVVQDVKSHEENKIWFGYSSVEDSAKRVIYKHNLCNIENVEAKIYCERDREPAIIALAREAYDSDQILKIKAELRENNPANIPASKGLLPLAVVMIVGGLLMALWIFFNLPALTSFVYVHSIYSFYKGKVYDSITEFKDCIEKLETSTLIMWFVSAIINTIIICVGWLIIANSGVLRALITEHPAAYLLVAISITGLIYLTEKKNSDKN